MLLLLLLASFPAVVSVDHSRDPSSALRTWFSGSLEANVCCPSLPSFDSTQRCPQKIWAGSLQTGQLLFCLPCCLSHQDNRYPLNKNSGDNGPSLAVLWRILSERPCDYTTSLENRHQGHITGAVALLHQDLWKGSWQHGLLIVPLPQRTSDSECHVGAEACHSAKFLLPGDHMEKGCPSLFSSSL